MEVKLSGTQREGQISDIIKDLTGEAGEVGLEVRPRLVGGSG